MMKNKMVFFLCLLLCGISTSGCSVQKAASIQDPHKGATLAYGRDRNYVISQLGTPETSEAKGSVIVDQYTLQRNSRGWGYFRATLYSFLDVGTFGLWELIGTPLEDFIQTDEMVTVEYDKNNLVHKVYYLPK